MSGLGRQHLKSTTGFLQMAGLEGFSLLVCILASMTPTELALLLQRSCSAHSRPGAARAPS